MSRPAGTAPGIFDGLETKSRPVVRAMSSPASLVLAGLLVMWGLVMADYRVFGLTAAIPVAILGLGLLVLQGWAREISLASAGVFASAMYYFNWLDRDDQGKGLPWIVAALIAVAIATAFMAGLALVSGRLPSIYLVILTLGLQVTIEKTIYPIGYLSGGVSGGNGGAPLVNPRPEPFGVDLVDDRTFYFFALAWLAVVLVLLIRLRRSPAGLAFLVVGSNRQSAAALGIPPVRFRVLAFTLAGFLAGTGGVLGAMFYVTPPLFLGWDVETSLLLLCIPVLAGVDSMAAVIVVAAYLYVMPIELERWDIEQSFIASVALGFGALFGARGVGGRMQDLERRRRFGKRRQRTRRKRMATAVLRESAGLADENTSVLSSAERTACLEVLERWLPPRPERGIALRTTDVRLAFGPISALTGASIEVPVGRMVGLIGPNGAGKTTLFDVVSGFTAPDTGTVELFGRDVTRTNAWDRSRLGMTRTFQNTRVIGELTAGDNICGGAWASVRARTASFVAGRPSAWAALREAEEAGYAAARLLDVHTYWDERVGTLEFSARRRVEIARALVAGPRLLLLDEPAAGLDPASSSAMFSLIRRLHSDLGLSVLIVEHYVKAVLDSCDLVHVLAEGRVLASGTPAEIAANTEVQQRYLGTRLDYLEGLERVRD
ncbi:ATP-binding cassette domain-containing protein [Sporichthya polymorpha]|uniref:branched-chain amino acid ABC transporter ATP-binding protein/permease n=1 Tax=Sporichthya polymorpha TaxID=35751 RepID=UPI00037D5828|nr:ATP-binding cassette domain-containing protein [Sporichthya polymorpha]